MKHTVQVTALLLIMFFAAQLIGLKITESYIDKKATQEKGELVWKALPSIAGVNIERPDIEPKIGVLYITLAVLIGTLLILLIIKLGTVLLWKLWFYLAVVMCLLVAMSAFISQTYALLTAILAGVFKVFKPNVYVHNITELFMYGGLAAIFVPILNPFYAFLTLLALSVYDMYAVWKSKHMIKMAKFQAKTNVFAGLLIPYLPTKKAKGKIRTAVLGGGDIGFPLIFAGTVLVTEGYAPAIIIASTATLSLFALLLLSQKNKFYPAMPFLTTGCAIGYALTFIL